MKPLVLVNGRPLIRHAFDHAENDWACDSFTVVASPQNVGLLFEVLPVSVNWIVQPRPLGVIDALQRGIITALAGGGRNEMLLVLCADNVFSYDRERYNLREGFDKCVFGARTLPADDARRFTRYKLKQDGVDFIKKDSDVIGDGCWIGPLYLPLQSTASALWDCITGQITDVEDFLMMATGQGQIFPIQMECSDMGVPEEYAKEKE